MIISRALKQKLGEKLFKEKSFTFFKYYSDPALHQLLLLGGKNGRNITFLTQPLEKGSSTSFIESGKDKLEILDGSRLRTPAVFPVLDNLQEGRIRK